jgi:hypothetical protein
MLATDWLGGRAASISNTMPAAKIAGCVMLLLAVSTAQDLPEAPHPMMDKTFVSLAALSTASTFADSYTTTWARQNWLAGRQNVCNIERQSPFLYGTHPTAARAYSVAAGKSLGSFALAYYLRKHHRRFWSAPLTINAVWSIEGMSQNLAMCN